jgi:hypothetical protein
VEQVVIGLRAHVDQDGVELVVVQEMEQLLLTGGWKDKVVESDLCDRVERAREGMTSRARLLAALAGEALDRLSWSPLIDDDYLASLRNQGYQQVDVRDAVRLVDGDVLELHVPAYRLTNGPTVRHAIESDGETRHEVFETPRGDLTTEMVRSRMGHTDYICRPLISKLEDVKTYRTLLEATRVEPDDAAFRARDARIGAAGLPTASGPMTPLQEFLQILCGVETTVYLLHDHPEEMRVCFEMMHARNKRIYQTLSSGPAKVIVAYENTSSTEISPAYYRRYCAANIDDHAEISHAGGNWFITHMCGRLRAFWDDFRTGRQDEIDSVCPPSTGDLWPTMRAPHGGRRRSSSAESTRRRWRA